MEIEEQITIVHLTPKQAKQWVMLQFLDSIGAFDVRLGRVILDFDKEGQVGNVSITYNYKPQKLST